MKDFDVYFVIYGKRLKTTVQAEDELKAKEIIRSKIIFDKVVLTPKKPKTANIKTDFDKVFEMFGDAFKK